MPDAPSRPTPDDFVEQHRDEFVDDLLTWLAIPSVSADPAAAAQVRRSADWYADAARRAGFPAVEVWDAGGSPAVFASWPSEDEDAPRVLVYGHHDVQPADPAELWDSPAFEPALRDGPRGVQVLGRGAADDKGQILFHLLGLRAHLASTGRTSPAVSLTLLVEGEEESGSPNLPALLRDRAEQLACDVVVVTDTGMWGADTPSVCTGMRGLTACQVDLHGPDVDLHSGSFGGAVRNPLTELSRIVAALHDDDGRVSVPGFYDGVDPLTDHERELFGRLPFDEGRWLEAAASREVHGEAGFSTLERLWARPTAEVNGIWGGYTGPGGKTIVPSDAHVKLSFRLVAGQDPGRVQKAFDSWLDTRVPPGLTATVDWEGGVRACLTPPDAPQLQAVRRSLARALHLEPVDGDPGGGVLLTREGGSGPEADLAEVLDAPVVFLGVGLPDDRIHAPNEKVELDLLLAGARAVAHLWSDLGSTGDVA